MCPGFEMVTFQMTISLSTPLQARFQFQGVHAGSRRVIPFALTNHSAAAAQVYFGLAEHTDFSLVIGGKWSCCVIVLLSVT